MSDIYWLNPFFGPSETEPILRDAFDWDTNGIFVALETLANERQTELPWGDENPEILDLAYFTNHSGGKFCAPLVKLLLQTDGMVDENGRLNSTATKKLAAILLRKYGVNWSRLWMVNEVTYNPVHNYDMHEERDLSATEDEEKVTDGTLRHSGTDSIMHGKVETTQHGRTESETETHTGTDTMQHGKVETTQHGKTETVSETHTGTDTMQHGKVETTQHGKTETETATHTGTDTTEYGKTEETEHGRTNEEIQYKFGLNTDLQSPKPSDKTNTEEGGTTTVTLDGSDVQRKNLTDQTSSSEGGTTTITDSGSDVQTKNLSDGKTTTDGGTTKITDSGSDVQTKNLSDSTTTTEGGTTSVTDSGTDTNTKNLTDKNDVSETLDNDKSEHEEIHRYGNIGVTTSQKMVEDERNLWLWNYFDQVFADLDRELALAFHDPCRV